MDDCLVATAEGELVLHWQMNHWLLDIFKEHSYFLKPSKCIFKQPEVNFLGMWLKHSKISIDKQDHRNQGQANNAQIC